MKLKYKKIIMLTALSTMGIGILTISLNNDKSRAKESLSPIVAQENIEVKDEGEEGIATAEATAADLAATSEDTARLASVETEDAIAEVATPTVEPTEAPTPTPLPVYDIEKDKYPEIERIFQDYYAAKNSSDVKKLKSMLTDPTKVETEEQLKSKTEYIDDYRNIKSYTKKGFIDGTYIVYVYYEIKFTSVNTTAPSLSKFYVVTDDVGELKIYAGTMDDELKAYFDERNNDEDVVKLIEVTESKSKKAKEKDEDLLNFWKGIEEMAKSQSEESEQAQGDEGTSKE